MSVVRTSREDSSSWCFASPPTSPPEPDPVARCASAGSRHLHVLRDGLRPRGLSPPRRLFSRVARACCSTAGRDSFRFPLLPLTCHASRHGPSFRPSSPVAVARDGFGDPAVLETLTPLEESIPPTAGSTHTDEQVVGFTSRPPCGGPPSLRDVARSGCCFRSSLSRGARSPSRCDSVG